MAGIHAKNNPHTKNMTPKQAMEGHSYIKTALQEHSG